MSAEIREWFAMDVEFVGSPKVQGAIKECQASLQLWLAMRSFVRRRRIESGEVPASNVDCLEGGPKRWRAALVALERHGLVERVADGWYIHDFHQHASELGLYAAAPADEGETREERTRRLSRARKRLSRDRQRDERDICHAPERDTSRPPPHTPSPEERREQEQDQASAAGSGDLSGIQQRDQERDVTRHSRTVRVLGCLRDALMLPAQQRARFAIESGPEMQWSEPQNWPEVKQVADALGLVDRVHAAPPRDRGVLRVVELLADFEAEALVLACERVRVSEWWRTGKPKGLSSLSPEVINRALADDGAPRPQPKPPARAAGVDLAFDRVARNRFEEQNR